MEELRRVAEGEIGIVDVACDKSAATVWFSRVNMRRNLRGMYPAQRQP